MPRMQLPKKLAPFVTKSKRFKIAIGGRGSGKSMSIADICLMDAMTKGIKTGCFREFQNSIEDSVHSLLSAEIQRLGLNGFDTQASKILFKGEEVFKFKGLARNTESIKSMHGFKRFWVEEAQTISSKSLKALTPTLRTEGSEIWMSANLQSSADPFYQRFYKPYEKHLLKDGFYEDDMHIITVINWSDNPFFPDVLKQEKDLDKEMLTTAEYLHIWEGHTNDEVEGSIITVDWFNAAIDAHIKLGFEGRGEKVSSFDPSDEGGDAKGYCERHGVVIEEVCEIEAGDVNDGCDQALHKAKSYQADHFVWDCDGLGISLKKQVNDYFSNTKTAPVIFKGSESPDNGNEIYQDDKKDGEGKTYKQTFKNKRAQYLWLLRDRFYNTYLAVVKGKYIDPDELISISSEVSDIDQLRAEVCRIPKKPNSTGLIQIKSKQEMLVMGINSPNMADSLMQSFAITGGEDMDFSMNYKSLW